MGFSQELLDKHVPQAKCIIPMKVWKLPENQEHKLEEVCGNGQYFAQIKKDGYWYQYEKTADHDYLFSRSVSKKTGILSNKIDNVPHIREYFKELPPETIIIGEIFFPDVSKTSKDVTSIMGCLPEEAIRRQEQNEKVFFYMHDIIYYGGHDLQNKSAEMRYKVLESVYRKYDLESCTELILADVITDNIFDFARDALNKGEEGVVLKRKKSLYTPDKRPAWDTIKIKKVDYADVVCIGFVEPTRTYTGTELQDWTYWINPVSLDKLPIDKYYPSYTMEGGKSRFEPVTKGYYYNWKSGLEIGAYDENGKMVNIGSVASGLTDKMRADCFHSPELLLNKVVMVQCMEKDLESKTLRHPFFKGYRSDKKMEDCLLSDIFI